METTPSRSSRRGPSDGGGSSNRSRHVSNSLLSSSAHGGSMRSGQVPASNVSAQMSGGNHGWKVKRKFKLAHCRHSGQDPASTIRAPTYHRRRGWRVQRRLNLARRHHRIHGGYSSSEAREQNMTSTPPLMQFMKYVPPLLLALVILKYQAKAQIMFREKPAGLWSFIAATSVYWLIVGVMKMPTLRGKWTQALSNVVTASAIFSTISLSSVFLPYPGSLLPVIVLISVPVALVLLYAFILFVKGIEYIIYKIHGVFVWVRGRNFTNQASSPA